MSPNKNTTDPAAKTPVTDESSEASKDAPKPNPETVPEIGGRDGPDPSRYGDWEHGGRCVDF